MTFGQALDNALERAVQPTGKGKRRKELSEAQRNAKHQSVLSRWLGVEEIKKYRDPMSKIKE